MRAPRNVPADFSQQLIGETGFDKESIAQLSRSTAFILHGVSRQGHDQGGLQAGGVLDPAGYLPTIGPGQPHVQHDNGRCDSFDLAQRLKAVSRLVDSEPVEGQEIRVHLAGIRVVLDDEHEGSIFGAQLAPSVGAWAPKLYPEDADEGRTNPTGRIRRSRLDAVPQECHTVCILASNISGTAPSASKAPLGVFIADDSPVIRERLAEMLASVENVVVVGQASDVPEAERGILATHPDVAIVDIRMPGGTGIDLVKRLKRAQTGGPSFMMYTSYGLPQYRQASADAGADFFFDKTQDSQKLTDAIRMLAARH